LREISQPATVRVLRSAKAAPRTRGQIYSASPQPTPSQAANSRALGVQSGVHQISAIPQGPQAGESLKREHEDGSSIGILKFLYMNVPPEWKEDFVTNSKSRLTNREQQAWIDKAMQRSDTSAIPDEYGMDTVSGSVVDNTNYQPKQKLVKENTTQGGNAVRFVEDPA
ncbi:RepA protein, putative, partial [Pseudomonas amygdali pv. aesculi str. 0893_23]